MIIKIVVIALWSLCFLTLNIGAKYLVKNLLFENGIWELTSSAIRSPWFYIVVIFYGACAFLYLYLLKLMPITIAGPVVLTLATIFLTLLGAFIFRENVFQVRHLLGVAFCVLGIIFLLSNSKTC